MSADEERKMVQMNRWLDRACAELGVDRKVLDANTGALLRLVGEVAHGPSRPGAPLTAFVVGLAAGMADRTAEGQAVAVAERVDAVRALVQEWRSEADMADMTDVADPEETARDAAPSDGAEVRAP